MRNYAWWLGSDSSIQLFSILRTMPMRAAEQLIPTTEAKTNSNKTSKHQMTLPSKGIGPHHCSWKGIIEFSCERWSNWWHSTITHIAHKPKAFTIKSACCAVLSRKDHWKNGLLAHPLQEPAVMHDAALGLPLSNCGCNMQYSVSQNHTLSCA